VDERNHIAATLREARERRELSVEAAAGDAGIPVRYARLLEGETPPVGISDELYLIPFFRRYAAALGLPAEDLLPDFLGQVSELPPPSAPPLQMRTRGRRRAPWRALAVIAAVAIASFVIMQQAPDRGGRTDEGAWNDSGGGDAGEKVAEAVPVKSAAEPPAANGEVVPPAVPAAAPAEQPGAVDRPAPAAVAEHAAPAAVAEHAAQAADEHAPERAAVEHAAPAVTSAEQGGADAKPPADGSHELRVSAAQETWFSLGIDDEPKRNIILQPGESRSWTAARAFTLTIGNAGGITVSIDGRELPPLGRPGHVVRNLRLPEEPPPANG
jgi:cytoskeleton protein RodZ